MAGNLRRIPLCRSQFHTIHVVRNILRKSVCPLGTDLDPLDDDVNPS